MSDNISQREMEKVTICVKRTQEGKTFTCIHTILKRIEEDASTKRSVHIIYTMNTLLNNRQFAKRIDTIEKAQGAGSVVVFASKYHGPQTHVKDIDALGGKFLTASKAPRIVIQCSNTPRFEDGVEILTAINETHSEKLRVFTYQDELHKYINPKLREKIQQIQGLPIVHGVLALTATPAPIWLGSGPWSRLRIMDVSDVSSPDYCGSADHHFICDEEPEIDEKCQALIEKIARECAELSKTNTDSTEIALLQYIAHVITRRRLLTTGARVFVPALHRVVSHAMVREQLFCVDPQTVVVTLNGTEKTLQQKSEDEEDISRPIECDDEEVCDVIARYIQEEGLGDRPLAITGYICVGMGQTLTTKTSGPFTAAILNHVTLSNEDIQQLFGRTTGRMRSWPTYCRTKVYCPEIIMKRCVAMEMLAHEMTISDEEFATLEDYYKPLSELGDEHKLAIMNNVRPSKEGRPKKPSIENKFEDGQKVFNTEEEAMAYWGTFEGKAPVAVEPDSNGFKSTSTSRTGIHSTAKIDKIVEGKKTANFGKSAEKMAIGDVEVRRYIGYTDTSDASTARYQIRWLKRISA